MTEKLKKEETKEETKPLTNAERLEGLRAQQERLKETFLKVQGAIEMLEALESEAE
tara:strand:- start:528 stop:695 length:168 start_codon:yes stop_codon:yes gene_type:complete